MNAFCNEAGAICCKNVLFIGKKSPCISQGVKKTWLIGGCQNFQKLILCTLMHFLNYAILHPHMIRFIITAMHLFQMKGIFKPWSHAISDQVHQFSP